VPKRREGSSPFPRTKSLGALIGAAFGPSIVVSSMIALLPLLALAADDGSCCASMKELADKPAFIAAHLSPQAIDFHPKYGKMVSLEVGSDSASMFVVPPAEGVKAGVVMIHEWWGLNDHIKREAERLREAAGYGVVAVDLYGGKVAQSSEEASKLMGSVDSARAREIVRFVVQQMKGGKLFGRPMEKVGSIGYCFGGGWSFQTALLAGKDVDACVIYYGMPETDPAKLNALSAPVLGIFGSRDKFINPEVVAKFEVAMKQASKKLTVHSYDADHAFANPSNPKYDKANADKAWKETLSFFKKLLG
jgi:carboxymethylenebutenolidase